MAGNKQVRIEELLSYTIPLYGNRHFKPYFTALVTDGERRQVCRSKGDTFDDHAPYQYITFRRKRYKVINIGSLYQPNYQLKEVEK